MPELPEVQTIVAGLSPLVTGGQIDRVKLRRRDILTPANTPFEKLARGRTIKALARRGKKIVFTLDNSSRFVIHLGMSGRLTLDRPNTPLKPHTHLIITVNKQEIRFVDPRRFGGLWWLGQNGVVDEGLGPEPLGLRSPALAKRLARTRRAIKVALLDQSLIAGIGNIYADESLYRARIHPLTPACDLNKDQVGRLNRAIQQTLRRAIRARGSTLRDYRDASGSEGSFQRLHSVYDRAGKPCPACHGKIARIVLGGRSTHFCPHCQKGPK